MTFFLLRYLHTYASDEKSSNINNLLANDRFIIVSLLVFQWYRLFISIMKVIDKKNYNQSSKKPPRDVPLLFKSRRIVLLYTINLEEV